MWLRCDLTDEQKGKCLLLELDGVFYREPTNYGIREFIPIKVINSSKYAPYACRGYSTMTKADVEDRLRKFPSIEEAISFSIQVVTHNKDFTDDGYYWGGIWSQNLAP